MCVRQIELKGPFMCDLNEMRPRKWIRVIDLLKDAKIDVSDWANCAGGEAKAGSNPRYCYDWAFENHEKNIVVLLLWFRNTEKKDGKCIQRHNFRELARSQPEHQQSRVNRAEKMDRAIRTAWEANRKVRVIVLEGKMRDRDDTKTSLVKKRLLDPWSWTVACYDDTTGNCRLERDAPTP